MPAPGAGGAYRVHHFPLEHPRQGFAPNLQQGIGQQVHPHVVIFEITSRLMHLPMRPQLRIIAFRAVRPVGHIPQGAGPVRCLLQQMTPVNLSIVFRFEVAIANPLYNRALQITDQTITQGKARHGRQVTLGHAEGHVHALEIAPLAHDVSAPNDEARTAFARPGRAIQAEIRLPRVK